jgi:hypothetical protein
MTTSSATSYVQTAHFSEFQTKMGLLSSLISNADQFHLQLYYSNVVSVMEKYLYDLYVGEITSCDSAFKEMCKLQKFSTQKYPLLEVLNQDIKAKVINSVQNLVWHRLNDLDPLFKKTINTKMNISQALKNKLALRHHFIHRNGYDLQGNAVVLTEQDVVDTIQIITDFIQDIDKKYHNYNVNK